MTDQTMAANIDGSPITNAPAPVEPPEAATPAPVPTSQPNVKLTKAELEKHAKEFGKQYGKGMNSRPALALASCQAAQQLADVKPEDAENLYTLFQQAAARSKGIEYKAESSFKVQVSKLKKFLELGSLPNVDGVAVLELTCDVIKEMAASEDKALKGSAYDNMVLVAREQVNNPEDVLSEERIRGLLTPEVHEKTDLEKLMDSYKKVRKLTETVDREPLLEALSKIGETITALGGEIPAEKAQAAKDRQVAALIRANKANMAKLANLTGQTLEVK